jgi:hypothetical protein
MLPGKFFIGADDFRAHYDREQAETEPGTDGWRSAGRGY